MGIEIKPVGVACNLKCTYCYQNDQRDFGDATPANDARILESIELLVGPVAILGGEPLLLSIDRLEFIFSRLLDSRGGCVIQTNGTLLSDEHIRLFRAYAVAVGISVDGTDNLNLNRPAANGELGNDTAKKSLKAIELLRREGIPYSVIITLTKSNTVLAARDSLLAWIAALVDIGCNSIRLHLLEVEPSANREKIEPNIEDLLATLDALYEFERTMGRTVFDLFSEMRSLLAGDDRSVSCVWHACDPYSTAAVTGVESDGSITNCGRTLDSGVNFLKAQRQNFSRYIGLLATPIEQGGCSGCRFFLACKGYCPGTSEAKDWRNKTDQCGVLMHVFERIEADMLRDGHEPVSKSPWRTQYEKSAIEVWSRSQSFSLFNRMKHQRTVHWEVVE